MAHIVHIPAASQDPVHINTSPSLTSSVDRVDVFPACKDVQMTCQREGLGLLLPCDTVMSYLSVL